MFSDLMRKKVSMSAVLKRGGLAYEIGLPSFDFLHCHLKSVTLGNKFNFTMPQFLPLSIGGQ